MDFSDHNTTSQSADTSILPTLISAPQSPPRYSLFGPPHYKRGYYASNKDSRLLRLPAELRTMIYEYALSYPEGLRCTFRDCENAQHGVSPTAEPTKVVLRDLLDANIKGAALNPFKVVCRQLYLETLDLLLKNNDLYFDTRSTTPYARYPEGSTLDCFLSQAKPHNLALLRKVTIAAQTQQSTIRDVFSLLNCINLFFCTANPHIAVLVCYYWGFNFSEREWVPWVVALQEAIRGASTIDLPDGVRRLDYFTRIGSLVASTPLSAIPSNLRFRLTESFPEAGIRREAESWYRGHHNRQEMVNKVVRQAEKVLEEGI